jgi:hypothetical protein
MDVGIKSLLDALLLPFPLARERLKSSTLMPDITLWGAFAIAGRGRKSLSATVPELVATLEALVEPTTRGDPMSPLRWTCKSTRKLAKTLAGQGHEVSHTKVAQLLADLNYSLQGLRKSLEGTSHADRDAQFRSINRCERLQNLYDA